MRFLAAIGALAIVVGIGAAAFFFGGYYAADTINAIIANIHQAQNMLLLLALVGLLMRRRQS
jgi:hypothetical protein